jgi:tRNA (cytidine/uridine-2'-O-)-methyltransferase
MALNIVLHEPEIPANTGNIARSCAATGARLHLIQPLGFSIEDKMLKRAGLDYWDEVEVKVYDTIKELYETYPEARFFYATTKTELRYSDVAYRDEDFIVFGRETAGLPIDLLKANWSQTIKLPMRSTSRSLNLSNAAAIVLYETLRQLDFKPIKD